LYRRLLHRVWRRHKPRPNAHPVQTLDQRRQLRRRQSHHAVLDARPAEFAALQPLGEQAQARAIPEDQLHSVGALGAEAEDHARERIGPQLLLHQRRKPVHPFAEVHGFRRHQHPDRSGRDQHSASHAFERQTARNTASTSRGLAPPGTRTLIIPITISMQAGRSSWVALFTCADFTDTTGTKGGISSAGRAKQPSLAALIQFDRCCGARSCRRATSSITAPGAIASATIRPLSSSLHRRRRTAPVTSARRWTIFVSSLMSTIMCTRSSIPRESRSCTTRLHSAMWGNSTAYRELGPQADEAARARHPLGTNLER